MKLEYESPEECDTMPWFKPVKATSEYNAMGEKI